MHTSPWLTMMLTCLTIGSGCSSRSDPDYVGPRTAAFKSGVSFAVHLKATSAGPQTISRTSPFTANESITLHQSPIVTNQDIKELSIEEAPGQWASITVRFNQNGVKRLSDAIRTEGCEYAVLIDDRIVAIYEASEGQDASYLELGGSVYVTDIHSFVD